MIINTEEHWCKVVGGEQRKVPAWYIYAFCEEGENVAWVKKDLNIKIKREVLKNHAVKWTITERMAAE